MEPLIVPESQQAGAGLLEWAHAGRPYPGQALSGDAVVVADRPNGAMIAVVDALGHGGEAAGVAAAAAAALRQNAAEPVIPLMRAVHQALRGSRGAVVSMGLLDARSDTRSGAFTWLGVGNVQGCVARGAGGAGELPPSESLLLRGGIVGIQLPPLYAAILPLEPGDLIVFATDGIAAGFMSAVRPEAPVGETAARVLRQHAMNNDDAIVVVARFHRREAPGGEEIEGP